MNKQFLKPDPRSPITLFRGQINSLSYGQGLDGGGGSRSRLHHSLGAKQLHKMAEVLPFSIFLPLLFVAIWL